MKRDASQNDFNLSNEKFDEFMNLSDSQKESAYEQMFFSNSMIQEFTSKKFENLNGYHSSQILMFLEMPFLLD